MCQPDKKHGCLENLDLCHSFANNKLIINANLQTVFKSYEYGLNAKKYLLEN